MTERVKRRHPSRLRMWVIGEVLVVACALRLNLPRQSIDKIRML